MSDVIDVELSTKAVLPLRATTAKSSNVYHAILDPKTKKAPGSYGVNVLPHVVGDALPTFAIVLGVRIPLESGLTGKEGDEHRNRKVEAKRVPIVYNDEPRLFNLRISKTTNGFNVNGSLTRPGGGGRAMADAL